MSKGGYEVLNIGGDQEYITNLDMGVGRRYIRWTG